MDQTGFRSLMVYPTHKNCRDECEKYTAKRIWSRCYPARVFDSTNPEAEINCWNKKADVAERMGFPVIRTVCPQCPSIRVCQQCGYLAGLQEASAADIAFLTHKRLEHTRFEGLIEGRCFVSIHEAPIDILRPRKEMREKDLRTAQFLLDRILSDPYYLDRFGETLLLDEHGHLVPDSEVTIRRERLYDFIHQTSGMVDDLVETMRAATHNVEWWCRISLRRPVGLERILFEAVEREDCKFDSQPWAFILAAASGELISSAILVTEAFGRAAKAEKSPIKRVVGFISNIPPPTITTWFNDATIAGERLSSLVGCEVNDTTPSGRLARFKKAVQIPRDVTRGTSGKTVQNILRGVLADRPDSRRVGVICLQPHVPAIRKLEPEYLKRIVKIEYFGSGEDRSSNDWHVQCDLIVIVGTPRVQPAVIATDLVQYGEIGAACREPQWGPLQWEGLSESGELVLVKSSGYLDPAWRRAHQERVRSNLVQAIGRGRGILETGCEVLLLSNEEAGLRISDAEAKALNASCALVLAKLTELTVQNANNIIRKWTVKSPELAEATGLSGSEVRKQLRFLEERGMVIRDGERGGWRAVVSSVNDPVSPRVVVDRESPP